MVWRFVHNHSYRNNNYKHSVRCGVDGDVNIRYNMVIVVRDKRPGRYENLRLCRVGDNIFFLTIPEVALRCSFAKTKNGPSLNYNRTLGIDSTRTQILIEKSRHRIDGSGCVFILFVPAIIKGQQFRQPHKHSPIFLQFFSTFIIISYRSIL